MVEKKTKSCSRWSDCTGPLKAGDYSTPPVTFIKCSLYFILSSVHQVYIMLSLASLVPISSHYYINNSPLSSTVRDMTILKELHILPYTMPAPSDICFL